jgi:hypothetical protein
LVGVAVRVTVDPWQKGFDEALIETLTARIGFTTIVIVLEVSGLFMIQPVIEEVKIHLTRSLFKGI